MRFPIKTFWKFALAMGAIVTFFLVCFFAALSASAGEYVVREGENLSVISRKTGASVSELMRANNLSGPDKIYMGQTLHIPESGRLEGAPPERRAGAMEAAPSPALRPASVRQALPVDLSGRGGLAAPSAFYTVREGDTLSSIARRYNATTSYLRELNELQGDAIYPGQKLRLRRGGSQEPARTDRTGGAGPEGGEHGTVAPERSRMHEVRQGETLSAISRKYDVSLSDIREWNGLSGDLIRVGQKLRVSRGQPEDISGTTKPNHSELHVVTEGETLFSISKQYGVSVPDLKAANELNSSGIWSGQKLTIPGEDFVAADRTGENSQIESATPTSYREAQEDWITPTSEPLAEANGSTTGVWDDPRHYLDLIKPGDFTADNQAPVRMPAAGEAPRAEAGAAGAGRTYVVQPSDTLWRISRKFDVDLEALRTVNSLTGDMIQAGRTLRIPSS